VSLQRLFSLKSFEFSGCDVIDANLHGGQKSLETISIFGIALLDEAKTFSKNLTSILMAAAGD
jgi:hypothetical protein